MMGPGICAGIALILINVDIRSVLQAGPRMLAAFGIGAVGTAVGAVAGALMLSASVGRETWKLGGQFTGTYTGAGVNFAALGMAFGTSADLFSAGIAADVIVTAIWMAACLATPVLLGRPGANANATSPPTEKTDGSKQMTLEHSLTSSGRPMTITDMSLLVVLPIGAVWSAGKLAELLPFLPGVLWLTTVVLVIAQIPAVKSVAGSALVGNYLLLSALVGNYLLLLYLASNGARSVIAIIIEVGPSVFLFAAITVAVHGVVIFGLGRLARIDLATLAVASQANVGGPATAMAIAAARGYNDRLLPGVAVGLMGLAVGNYAGFAIGGLVRGLLGF
jgi:uncharacterized membrane protein